MAGWRPGSAARGYIVAAVMHPGDNALAPKTLAGLTMGWLRAGDLSRTIDAVSRTHVSVRASTASASAPPGLLARRIHGTRTRRCAHRPHAFGFVLREAALRPGMHRGSQRPRRHPPSRGCIRADRCWHSRKRAPSRRFLSRSARESRLLAGTGRCGPELTAQSPARDYDSGRNRRRPRRPGPAGRR